MSTQTYKVFQEGVIRRFRVVTISAENHWENSEENEKNLRHIPKCQIVTGSLKNLQVPDMLHFATDFSGNLVIYYGDEIRRGKNVILEKKTSGRELVIRRGEMPEICRHTPEKAAKTFPRRFQYWLRDTAETRRQLAFLRAECPEISWWIEENYGIDLFRNPDKID